MSRKEYVAKIKIKNNLILSRILERWPNVAQFCDANGLSTTGVGNFINMKERALLKDGQWSALALRLADALDVLVGDLFTEEQAQADLLSNEAFVEMDRQQALTMSSGFMELENKQEVALLLGKANLTAKEQAVVLGIANDKTHVELGRELGVSSTRVGQCEHRALSKLRIAARWIRESEEA